MKTFKTLATKTRDNARLLAKALKLKGFKPATPKKSLTSGKWLVTDKLFTLADQVVKMPTKNKTFVVVNNLIIN